MYFFDYHNDCFLGLARDDVKLSNAKKSEWAYPSVSKKKGNAKKWENVESSDKYFHSNNNIIFYFYILNVNSSNIIDVTFVINLE